MDDVAYWRVQAADYRERADATKDAALHEELLELACICEEVAATIEERAPSG